MFKYFTAAIYAYIFCHLVICSASVDLPHLTHRVSNRIRPTPPSHFSHHNHPPQLPRLHHSSNVQTIIPVKPVKRCTEFENQSDCHYPPLQADLPPCGEHISAADSPFVFPVLGDFGIRGNCHDRVADLFHNLNNRFGPFQFVLTTGDNAYWGGSCHEHDDVVGTSYGEFLLPNLQCVDPPKSGFDLFAASLDKDYERRLSGPHPKVLMYPTIGNHDYNNYGYASKYMPYFQYFTHLLEMSPREGNGHYYSFQPHPNLEFFCLNSNLNNASKEAKEREISQSQIEWIREALQDSTAQHKVVFFHHPPVCTSQHGGLADWMDFPFEQWGATAVMNGHMHVYERTIHRKSEEDRGIPYIVQGLSGHSWIYSLHHCDHIPGSQLRYNRAHGVLMGFLNESSLDFCFYSVEDGGKIIDSFSL